MKFKEYVERLSDILDHNPEYGEFEAIYASDDEGNRFDIVGCYPSPEMFDFEEREIVDIDDLRDDGIEDQYTLNCIVIN